MQVFKKHNDQDPEFKRRREELKDEGVLSGHETDGAHSVPDEIQPIPVTSDKKNLESNTECVTTLQTRSKSGTLSVSPQVHRSSKPAQRKARNLGRLQSSKIA